MVVMLLNLNQNLGSHTSIARLAAVVSNNPTLDSRLVPLNRVQKYSATRRRGVYFQVAYFTLLRPRASSDIGDIFGQVRDSKLSILVSRSVISIQMSMKNSFR